MAKIKRHVLLIIVLITTEPFLQFSTSLLALDPLGRRALLSLCNPSNVDPFSSSKYGIKNHFKSTLASFAPSLSPSQEPSPSPLSSTALQSSTTSTASCSSSFKQGTPKKVEYDSRDVRKYKPKFDLKSKYNIIQYLWPDEKPLSKFYLLFAMLFMIMGKWLNLQVPFLMQETLNILSQPKSASNQVVSGGTFISRMLVKFIPPLDALTSTTAAATLTLISYGVSKALSVVFAEIKTALFAHVSFTGLRKFANQIFQHLHELDAEFHLKTPSGVVSVAYVRAIRGFQGMLFQIVFSVIPTMLELGLVSRVLYKKYGQVFSFVTLATFTLYALFTTWITQWRVKIRQELVQIDNQRNGYFIDSILNHEVVKYFTNEDRELKKFDSYLKRIFELNIESTYAVAILNFGQATMFCTGLTITLLLAMRRVRAGIMTVGDLIAINGLLMQLSIPFNFMGYTYQEIRQASVDMSFMQNVLRNVHSPVFDDPSLPDLDTLAPITGPSSVLFKNVVFRYPNSTNDVLNGVSFSVAPGQNVAIVGPSGSGKSTIMRLITRMFDVTQGSVSIDHVDTRAVRVKSLRKRIAVVPQDTSLFDETIEYNLRYGNSTASSEDLIRVVEKCSLNSMLDKMPLGFQTPVGERGARLSGGERQKVSIARALLKDPSLILCDEVTSAVDAFAERDITDSLRRACESRTTITIAHRLSSIIHCDTIIVMDQGCVVEQGSHEELLKNPDGVYCRMWRVQNNPSASKLLPLIHNNSSRSSSSSSSNSGTYNNGNNNKGLRWDTTNTLSSQLSSNIATSSTSSGNGSTLASTANILSSPPGRP